MTQTQPPPPFTPPPGGPYVEPHDPWRTTSVETTRLLSAGTYLNPQYREAVLEATVRDPTRFICPSFGVDIATVVRHALVAHRRAVIRDVLLLVYLLTLAIVLGHAVVTAGSSSLGSTEGEFGGLGTTTPESQTGGGHTLLAIVLLLLLAVGTVFADALIRRTTLWQHLVRGRDPNGGPVPSAAHAASLNSLRNLVDANVVVFAAPAPFVGSGFRVDGGTVAMHLQGKLDDPKLAGRPDSARHRQTPVPFDERQLLDRLTRALGTLRLQGLRVQERIYVNGVDAKRAFNGRLFRNNAERPIAYADNSDLARALSDPMGSARHYLCAETTGWHGQLVTTTFIRVVKLPEMLYVESSAYALPPLLGVFRAVDTMNLLSQSARVSEAMGDALRQFVPLLVQSPAAILRAISAAKRPAQRVRQYHAAVRDHILVDQGAVTSVRQAASGAGLLQYYLEQDMVMHVKAVSTRLTEVLQEFLAELGYDTGELNFKQDVSFHTVNNGGYIGSVGTQSTGTVNTGSGGGAKSQSALPPSTS